MDGIKGGCVSAIRRHLLHGTPYIILTILIPVSTYCVCRWNLVLVLQHARPRPRQAARQNSGSVSHSQSDWGHGVMQQQQQHGWTGAAALRREKKDGAKEANDHGFNLDITRRERVLKGEAFVRRGHGIGTLIKYPLTGPRTCIARWCSLPDNIDRHRCLFWSLWGEQRREAETGRLAG